MRDEQRRSSCRSGLASMGAGGRRARGRGGAGRRVLVGRRWRRRVRPGRCPRRRPRIGPREDTARYILPPGNYGGAADHRRLARPAPALRRRSRRCAATSPRPTSTGSSCRRTSSRSARRTRSETGRPGLRLVYDAYGIPHVYGKTRADVAFGAGWMTARDRGLLIQLGRGPARVAVADVPGIDAFGARHQRAVVRPQPEAEALVDRAVRAARRDLRRRRAARSSRDAQAYADGINAYCEANGIDAAAGDRQRRDRRDRVHRLDLRRRRRRRGRATPSCSPSCRTGSGAARGHEAWDDVMLADDPEAPTTIDAALQLRPADRRQGHRLGRRSTPGSIEAIDPTPAARRRGGAPARRERRRAGDAAAAPPASRRRTSCWSPPSARRPATRWP